MTAIHPMIWFKQTNPCQEIPLGTHEMCVLRGENWATLSSEFWLSVFARRFRSVADLICLCDHCIESLVFVMECDVETWRHVVQTLREESAAE